MTNQSKPSNRHHSNYLKNKRNKSNQLAKLKKSKKDLDFCYESFSNAVCFMTSSNNSSIKGIRTQSLDDNIRLGGMFSISPWTDVFSCREIKINLKGNETWVSFDMLVKFGMIDKTTQHKIEMFFSDLSQPWKYYN